VSVRGELVRKALHLSWSVIPVAYAGGLDRTSILVVLGLALLVAIGVEMARLRVTAVGEGFRRLMGPLLRPHEARQWSGATWLILSFLVAVAVFPHPVAVVAMWAVSVGDASAGIAGRLAGKQWGDSSRKTVIGSLACALATFFGGVVVAQLSVWESALSGLVAALAEWPSGPGDDNLRIGIAVGAGILLSRMVFS
jgi:dolichol kinase